jgi:putative membrane protein
MGSVTLMLWLKTFHIIAMVAWFAGVFYLPRLFVYHAETPATEPNSLARFCTMESRLYWGIMTPSAVVTLILGVGLMHSLHYTFASPPNWLALKLLLVGTLVVFHGLCGWLLIQFKRNNNVFSATFYRWINEIPVVILVGIVWLVVLKPF